MIGGRFRISRVAALASGCTLCAALGLSVAVVQAQPGSNGTSALPNCAVTTANIGTMEVTEFFGLPGNAGSFSQSFGFTPGISGPSGRGGTAVSGSNGGGAASNGAGAAGANGSGSSSMSGGTSGGSASGGASMSSGGGTGTSSSGGTGASTNGGNGTATGGGTGGSGAGGTSASSTSGGAATTGASGTGTGTGASMSGTGSETTGASGMGTSTSGATSGTGTETGGVSGTSANGTGAETTGANGTGGMTNANGGMPTSMAQACLRLEVANPSPGDMIQPGGYVVEGFAFDPLAAPNTGSGIGGIQVFLGDPDQGGMILGSIGTMAGANATSGAEFGTSNPRAAGFGEQFGNSGFRVTVQIPQRTSAAAQPSDALFVSATTTNGDRVGTVAIPVSIMLPTTANHRAP